ncbi:histidine phosphatase family protein [Ferrimonas kyonanensis]|uniref:histidine phosphatase family protein n=1 Tax=Ferrimonas kyonanensis TaxID=364763 RepID=UPI00040FBC8A|nr:histidine phosphatase family protein [Ferrimonas kyonanensis]
MTTTEFHLVRHGQPQDAERLLGRSDPELTELGWRQWQSSCAPLTWQQLYSSPLRRCAEFGQQLARQRHCSLQLDDRLQELDFGEWDGQALAQLWQRPEGDFEAYWQQPWQQVPPGGESTDALLQRVTGLLAELAERHRGETVLLLTHSGVIRVLLSWLLGGQQQGNAHLSRVALGHAARLHIQIYIDEQGLHWPQLMGLFPAPTDCE